MTGPELKALRRAHGLTLRKLAELLGMPHLRSVQRWEAGDRKISLQVEKHIRLVVQAVRRAQQRAKTE